MRDIGASIQYLLGEVEFEYFCFPGSLMASFDKKDPLWNKAYKSLTRYLGTRDHSDKELRIKLSQKYPKNLVEEMITLAHENHLIAAPTELAQRTAERLIEKGKGSRYINSYLDDKGLPSVIISGEEELKTARRAAEVKFGDLQKLEYHDELNLYRFLGGRGFSEEIINKVVLNK